jgi:uncharacterized protein
MTPSGQRVVVLGATPKPDRFAFKAMRALLQHGYDAVPVNPAFQEVLGVGCYRSIADVPQPIDTVTLYLGSLRSDPLIPEILEAKPRRIIMNPGAENDRLESEAESRGIQVLHDCTLVMLSDGSF